MGAPARGRRRAVGAVVVALVVITGAVAWVTVGQDYYDRYRDRLFSQSHCTVTLEDQEYRLTAEQTNNAALITAVSARRELPARAATIAIATAIQESSLRNIDYGDRDSVGLFQQRPSQGWGSVEEIMDPYYSSGRFYDELVTVADWQTKEVTVAAQAVQRSAFPNAYAQHESAARLWASALRGHSGYMPLDCSLSGITPSTFEALAERLDGDFGPGFFIAEVTAVSDTSAVVTITATSGAEADLAMVSGWLVATASVTGVSAVLTETQSWTATGDDAPSEWAPTDQHAVVAVVTTG